MLLAVVGSLAAVGASRRSGYWQPTDRLSHVARRVVHRTDLGSVLTASGLTESGSNTVISCQLERLEFNGVKDASMTAGGAATIIDVVPEGTTVKQGDVLCKLDSSEYEELVRQQQIRTDQSRALLLQSRLDFEVAQLAVREYTEGALRQNLTILEGDVVFAESTLERSVDRLHWTKRMLEKGYASVAQCATAERAVHQAELTLNSSRWQLDLFRKFGNPKTLKGLDAAVEKARYTLIANERRLIRFEERLAHYRKMVEYCTIRAPHDGFVIYAYDNDRPSKQRIEPGESVRQSQKLFFLPDLEEMTVKTYLHESVAQRVREGMAVRTRIEGLGGRMLEGHVIAVAPLPVSASNGFASSNEVKFFIGTVKLDTLAQGLRPGMTAEVVIDVDRRRDVLAIPSEAVSVVGGRDVCYVAGEDGLERRSITIGHSTKDLLEVTSGLNEGEEVVMRPDGVESIDALVASTEPEASDLSAPGGGDAGPSATPTVD